MGDENRLAFGVPRLPFPAMSPFSDFAPSCETPAGFHLRKLSPMVPDVGKSFVGQAAFLIR
jgi:hypothetical protein